MQVIIILYLIKFVHILWQFYESNENSYVHDDSRKYFKANIIEVFVQKEKNIYHIFD